MPVMGFGTSGLKGRKAINAISWALDNGYRHIDTSTMYGNEEEIGKTIAHHTVDRKDIFITTKLQPRDFGEGTINAFELSLKKLQTDYIDQYLIHWLEGPSQRWTSSWKIMSKLQEQGKIRSIGISNFTVKQIQELIYETGIVPEVDQTSMNPFNYKKKEIIFDFLKKTGVQIVAYNPLTWGQRIYDEQITPLTKKYNKTHAQILLRWGLQPNVPILPKSQNEKRIKQNREIFDFEISGADMQYLDGLK